MATQTNSDGGSWLGVASKVIAGGLTLYATSKLVSYAIGSRKSQKQLPRPPGEHWLLGSIPTVSKEMVPGDHIDKAIAALMKKYPSVSKFFQMNFVFINFAAVCDPDAIKEITITQNLRKSPTYITLEPFIGRKSMVIADGAVWRKSRQVFSPGFSHAHIRSLVPMFVDRCQVLLTRLQRYCEQQRVIKMHHELTLLTMDVITRATLSVDLGFLDGEEPPALLHDLNDLVTEAASYAEQPHMILLRFLPWNYLRMRRLVKRVDQHLDAHIRQRLAEYAAAEQAHGVPDAPGGSQGVEKAYSNGKPAPTAGSSRRQDVLDLAVASAMADGGRLDYEEVLAQVKTFLFAGHDTTASSLAFVVYELTRHPEVEAKMVEEIDRVLQGRLPTTEDLAQLKYTTAVFKEALRMWPLGGTARMGPHGTNIQGYDVGNVVLYCSQIHLHRDPDLWGPDAGEFRPERWLDESYVQNLHPMAYMPFSKGPRDCIGQVFAMMEAKTVLAMMYQHFTFRYEGTRPEEQGNRITSYPKYRVPVSVHPRKTPAPAPAPAPADEVAAPLPDAGTTVSATGAEH